MNQQRTLGESGNERCFRQQFVIDVDGGSHDVAFLMREDDDDNIASKSASNDAQMLPGQRPQFTETGPLTPHSARRRFLELKVPGVSVRLISGENNLTLAPGGSALSPDKFDQVMIATGKILDALKQKRLNSLYG